MNANFKPPATAEAATSAPRKFYKQFPERGPYESSTVWVLLLLGAAGGFFACIGAYVGYLSLQYSFGTLETDGRIVAFRKSFGHDSDGRVTEAYYPIVHYTVDGHPYTLIGKSGSSSKAYEVDEPVRVLYRPTDPQDAQLNSFTERWLGTTISVGVGLLVAYLCSVPARHNYRLRKRSSPASEPLVTS